MDIIFLTWIFLAIVMLIVVYKYDNGEAVAKKSNLQAVIEWIIALPILILFYFYIWLYLIKYGDE